MAVSLSCRYNRHLRMAQICVYTKKLGLMYLFKMLPTAAPLKKPIWPPETGSIINLMGSDARMVLLHLLIIKADLLHLLQ